MSDATNSTKHAAPRREVPGQIMPDAAPFYYGPLMTAVLLVDPDVIEIAFSPGQALSAAGSEHPQADLPTVTWAVGSGRSRREGPLSTQSFISLWNQGVDEVDGRTIKAFLDADAETAEAPFVLWHPSGFWQAVRFDKGSDRFRRRILYPL